MQKLYYGGDIITMVNENDAPEAVVAEDGKITFVGKLADAKAQCRADAEEIDLKGKTLMPSFIDGHSHMAMYSQFSSFPDVSGCTSFEEIISFLRDYQKEHPVPEGSALFATGYDHNFLAEERHPDRKVLDQISTEIPICLYHVSGHMVVINTALLKMAGLKEDAADPKGGHYGRYEDGTLNGYLEEMAAFGPVLMKVFATLKMNPVKQMQNVQDIYLKYGITTVQDGATARKSLEGLIQMAENHMFKVDVVSYVMAEDAPEKAFHDHEAYANKYHNRLKIGGAKILLDGSPQGKSAWLTRPYEGEESYAGYPTHEDEAVEAAAVCAIENGYQLLAHANGDAASDQFIRCYEKAMAQTGDQASDLRPVMIHCQTARRDQLEEMAKIGMLPSIFVAHTYYWGDVHLKNLGAERGAHISPVRWALDCGLKYNFHQDCPVLAPDMMKTIWCAVNRETRRGAKIGADQCISVFDALKGVTINAAYAYHEEACKGTIETGKLADLVILSENPLKAEKERLADIEVLETMKEGQTLYRKNK